MTLTRTTPLDFNAGMTTHPARLMPFDDLCSGLSAAVAAGHVRVTERDGATLYCYTKDCVYDRAWTPITTLARGLIIDHKAREILATPFPKFFNAGEMGDDLPSLPFEAFEKMDGSLIIIYWHNGRPRCATKGSLDSEQARWAQRQLDKTSTVYLMPGCTYLCEAVYAANRIVVQYPWEGLCLLGGYNQDGLELAHYNVDLIAKDMGWRCAKRVLFNSLYELVTKTKLMTAQEEGYVLRFTNGLRVKMKSDAYCAVHRLISGCTPLALWEAMLHGCDLQAMRKQLPEEFWTDFDKIIGLIGTRLATLLHQIDCATASVADLSDRELGKTLKTRFPGPYADFVFHRRKKGTCLPPVDPLSRALPQGEVPKIRRAVFMTVRPTGNRLEGYTPSAAVHRVQEDVI